MKKFLALTMAGVTLIASAGMPAQANADNWKNRKGDHDWGKGRHWDRKPDRAYYYNPRPYYSPPRTRVVYVQPRYNYSQPYFSQTFASPTTTTTTYYPDGSYTQTYTVGGYLPNNRVWHPIPDYTRHGLARPRGGERWVGNGRDAVLISEATSRIISGVLLASYID